MLVVDDGSRDGTPDILREIAGEVANVRFERPSSNHGKASALRTGFTRALDEGAHGIGVVTGARLERQDRFIKRNASKVDNVATGKLSGTPGRDFDSGFRVMSSRCRCCVILGCADTRSRHREVLARIPRSPHHPVPARLPITALAPDRRPPVLPRRPAVGADRVRASGSHRSGRVGRPSPTLTILTAWSWSEPEEPSRE